VADAGSRRNLVSGIGGFKWDPPGNEGGSLAQRGVVGGMDMGMDYEGTTGIRAVHAEWLTSSDGGIEQREKTSCEHSPAEQSQGQTHSPLKCTVYHQLRRASGMLCNKTMAASLCISLPGPQQISNPQHA
jgi:hypothetical protein